MRLTQESVRVRWTAMVLAWAIASGLLFWHATVVDDYLAIVNQLGLRGQASAGTPLSRPYPAFAADAQTWVRHALSLIEGDSLRLRHTTIDNAPHGREVHWNSAWAWTIAGAGWLEHVVSGRPLVNSVERMTVWLNPFVLSVFLIVFSGWVAKRAGAALGVLVAFAMAGHPRIFEGFFPSYVDHHGLLSVAVLGMVLGATFMGAGWRSRNEHAGPMLFPATDDQAHGAAVVSAVSGAFGLWVSAASAIPPIAIVGAAGLLTVVVYGRRAPADLRFDPEIWRLWGRVGGAASLLFYLLEYFPSHLGFRMEPNHPLYGVAWWGGGELIAEIGRRLQGSPAQRWQDLQRIVLPVVGVSLAPLTILIGGPKVFVVIDPFLAELHRVHIQEFLPLWKTLKGTGWRTIFSVVGAENIPLILGIGLIVVRRRALPPVIWFTTAAAVVFTAMAWMQSRWLLNASGSQVALMIAVLIYFLKDVRLVVRWAVVLVTISLVFLPSAITRATNGRDDVLARRVTPKDAQSMLSRDIAAAIRRSQPRGDIVVASSPNFSTSVGYYGRFKTLGTLYWENSEGLKAAASLMAAKSPDEAAALVRKYGVTHFAMISEENFIEPYFRLLNPNATDGEVRKCFGFQLLIDRVVPPWLQMIPYKVPDDLGTMNITVMLFKVAFEQTPADAVYHIALGKIVLGMIPEAEQDFDLLIKQTPESYQPWLRKGELLFARKDWKAAADALLNGIGRAPLNERMQLYANWGSSFYKERQLDQVVRFYRAALTLGFEPNIASYLAFVLASASDEKLRNAEEAVTLAQRALAADPKSTTFLNAVAAAYAASGRFDDAVASARQALEFAQAGGDTAAANVSEQRLNVYLQRKPWRE